MAFGLKKLKDRSVTELRVRGEQKLAALLDSRGWSDRVRLPDDAAFLKSLNLASISSPADLLAYFREHQGQPFFPAFADQPGTINELIKRWPKSLEVLREEARQIENGRFDLLGFQDLSFGAEPDWHLEPNSGKRSPLLHWSKLQELDAEGSGDKKITWELNRHQFFITLGRAYWATGDERHARAFVDFVSSWMKSNPPGLGLNWLSSLEVSFRAISWLWALNFFRRSPSLSPEFFLEFLKYLSAHGRHIETYLSTYSSPNTHLTGEALGLYYLGSCLPEFPEATRWRTLGEKILLAELDRHVRPDGVYFEQSSYYHRYTVDFYTHFYVLARQHGSVFASVADKLQQLLDHLMYITRPDRTTPFFGDDDGGKLLKFEKREPDDFRAALSNGAALFNRSDYKFVAGDAAEETLWLLGPEGLAAFDQLVAREPAKSSIGFSSGGYYVMRDGWSKDSNYLLFDCGPHGTMNCGHAHADALSFQLAAGGRTLLIDPGTFTYTGSKQLRDWFRSSAAHNTLTLEGESSSLPDGPFSWRAIANSDCRNWISRYRFDFVEGSHDGYSRLSWPATHARSILFLKDDYWVVRDSVKSDAAHQADLWFHFEAGTTPLIRAVEGQAVMVSEESEQNGLDIVVFGNNARWRREESSVSHCYGVKETGRVYVSSSTITSDGETVTFLLPHRISSATHSNVREIEAIGGRALEVSHERGKDVLMLRNSKSARVETERLGSDFEWTWARFGNSQQATPIELLLIGGQTLQLEGREILSSTKRIQFLVTRQVGEQLTVETEAGTLDLNLPIHDLESVFAELIRQTEN